jgi:DNA-binding NarL/FixJ family response regulator
LPERFLIVDDHPLFLDAIKLAITSAFPAAEIKEATSIDGARTVLNAQGDWDLVLLDLTMPGTQGFDGLLELRSQFPKIPIVIISALDDAKIVHHAMTCGAAGFISKSVQKQDLAESIQSVFSGSVCLPKGYTPPKSDDSPGSLPDLMTRLQSLTPQQLRVLHMLRQGLLNKQIAFKLGVGETTVKAHVSEILRKLDVISRTQAVIEVSRIDFEALSGPDDRVVSDEA